VSWWFEVTKLLQNHYDTTKYGLSVYTVRRLRKEWNILSTRKQKHSAETIYAEVSNIRERHPLRGIEGIRKTLREEQGMRVPRPLIAGLLKTVEPEEVANRRQRGFCRRHFWAAGVNDVWPQDQHDKWGRFGLWLHAGIEAFSGEINWMKIWWTNKNPRLVAKFYLDTCRQIGGVPIITQSDPGTENYGVANAQTAICHRLDPNLADTLQHRFSSGHNNILSEIKWSVFRRDFAPGFEDILELGVNNGWYDVNNTLENFLFRWIAIPWLQGEIDNWVKFKNRTAPRRQPHKILPHGIPCVIRSQPSHFNAYDFKIPVPPVVFDEIEQLYAPPDHAVFTLVPPTFHERATELYLSMGEPEVTVRTFWDIYCDLLARLREPMDEQLTEVLDTFQLNLNDDAEGMALLPNMEPFRLGQPLNLGGKSTYLGGLEESSEALPLNFNRPGAEFALFTDYDSSNESGSDVSFS